MRPDRVVAAVECKVSVGGRLDETRTLYAYVSSPITVEDWGIRIEEAQADKATWSEHDVECAVDIPDEAWPYCVGSNRTVPEGYSACFFMNSAVELAVKKIDGSSGVMGKKIRN